jgi:hypothetical protein
MQCHFHFNITIFLQTETFCILSINFSSWRGDLRVALDRTTFLWETSADSAATMHPPLVMMVATTPRSLPLEFLMAEATSVSVVAVPSNVSIPLCP